MYREALLRMQNSKSGSVSKIAIQKVAAKPCLDSHTPQEFSEKLVKDGL
jgi:hypothetical protein